MVEAQKVVNPLKMALEWTGAGRNILLARFKNPNVLAGPVNTAMMRVFGEALPAGLSCLLYAEAETMVLECADPVDAGDPEAYQMAAGEDRTRNGFALESGVASDGAF